MSALGAEARAMHAAAMADLRDIARRLQDLIEEREVAAKHDESGAVGEGPRMYIPPTATMADIARDIAGRHADEQLHAWLGLLESVDQSDIDDRTRDLVGQYVWGVSGVRIEPERIWISLSPGGIELGLTDTEKVTDLERAICRARGWAALSVTIELDEVA